jgi:hypothetical protein
LSATHRGAVASGGRYLRFVDLLSDTSERYNRDLAAILLDRGLAVSYPSNLEPARNGKYVKITRAAQARGVGIWDRGPLMTNGQPSGSDKCGGGPYQTVPIKLVLRWDADGNDEQNLNDEWVRIENHGDVALPLNGWVLRDSAHIRFRFSQMAPGTVIPPHDWITVHTGSGRNGVRHLYWRRLHSSFANERLRSGRILGDGAYLLDRHNDMRAFTEYPCIGACRLPLGESIDLSGNYDGYGNDDEDPNREWVNIRNKGTSAVDLEGYVLEAWPYSYEFRGPTLIQPGERLRLYAGRGTDTRLTRYWGRKPYTDHSRPRGIYEGSILGAHDSVAVRAYTGETAVRFTWSTCPTTTTSYTVQACPRPAVSVAAVDPRTDSVTLQNNGSTSVDLIDWYLRSWGDYSFDSHYELEPGETVVVRPGDPADDRAGVLHSTALALADSSGAAHLYTPYHAPVSCRAWGGRVC